ncbi:MAG: DUF2141 domain-containing protein [Flavobacteriaceae bacterium]|nr:DUF2141 domain-containing protein [Flavobacteriaceae bacterium]
MKTSKLNLKMSCLLLLALLQYGVSFAQKTSKLEVEINPVTQPKGEVYVGLFEQHNFLKEPTYGKMVKADQQKLKVVFENIPQGEYAIAIYQDFNSNQDMDFDNSGMPLEPWAISGKEMQGMSQWEFAKFSLNKKRHKTSFKL